MKLYPHQKEALRLTNNQNRVAYYLDMGLGKTYIGSEKAVSFGKNILVVCQKSKIDDWVKHFGFNYMYGYNSVNVYDITNKSHFEKISEYITHNLSLNVFVINYDLIWRRKELLQLKDFTLMLDESSLIQNSKTKACKFILKMNPTNIILLSGTPCSGKYENLWSQAHLLGWGISEKLFMKHYINFKKIEAAGMVFKIVDKENPYKNQERLKNKLREHGAVFMKTEEVFDLPSQNFIDIVVSIPKEYPKFLRDSIVKVGDVELIGNTQLTKLLYARQLCSQYNQAKLEAVADLIQSTNDRLVVFYNFNAELEKLKEICIKNERPLSFVNGPVKDLTNFEKCDNGVILVQYQAGSKGLNLQLANKIIYFSPTQSVENWMQSQKRIHRIGQEQPCFYYKLMSGIDIDIYDSIERGVDYTDKLFKH